MQLRESTRTTWQPRVDFLWGLDPFALCLLLVGAGQGRLWCKSFAGQPPWPVETVAFSTEKRALLYVDMIKAPNDRGRSAFQAPNAEDQTLFASSGGHSGGMNGPSPEASASYGHRLRFSIRPAKVGPHSVMP